VSITPADQTGACVDCFPVRAAFPKLGVGRRPHCYFRGLLRLHSRYGPLDRSTARGGLCHEAPDRPVAQPIRSSASRPIDNCPGGTFLHRCHAPSGRTPKSRIALDNGALGFFGELAPLAERHAFAARIRSLRKIDWVVYAKPPFGGPEQVLAYLARYTHRAAIANSRLVEIGDDEVAFAYKDYRRDGRRKVMRLKPDEFIRRFLLHVLPDGFHRIRHYGFLARGDRNEKLELCRKLAAANQSDDPQAPTGEQKSAAKLDAAIVCPDCGALMRRIAAVPPFRPRPFRRDTS